MGKPSGFLRLMRPINCVMMGFAVIVGAAIANAGALGSSRYSLIYGFMTGFTLTAASMSINDYYDRDIDAINVPNRPIPSGSVKPNEAIAFALILTGIGFVSAFLTSIPNLVVAIVAWAVFVTYTTVGKRSGLPGNFLVSICVGIPLIYGNYMVADAIAFNILIFTLMIFLSVTGREITKGIVDVKGDKARNIKTLAVLFGERTAATSAAAFYLIAVLLTPLPWLLRTVSVWFIPIVAITDIGLVASSYMLLKDYSRESARRIKNFVLLWFLVALFAFVIGALK